MERKNGNGNIVRMFENAYDAMYLVDRSNGKILSANAAAARMLGCEQAELCDRNFYELSARDAVIPGSVPVHDHPLSDESFLYETVHIRKDGSAVPVEVGGCVDNSPDHSVVYYNVRDLSMRHRMQEQRQRNQKMEAVGALAAGLTHYFNNVLMAVLGFTELALRESSDGPVITRLENIIDTCQQARSMVAKILSFSGKPPQNLSFMSLADVVSGTVEILKASFPSSVAIVVDYGSSDLKIQGDSSQLEQVIVNICTNSASAFRNREGTISVYLAEQILDGFEAVELDLEPGRYACLAIADNGEGMSDETRNRVFDPFFTTRKQGGGTGLGLSIVHGIVKGHRGVIRVSSEIGKGTRFTIFLPLAEHAVIERVTRTMKIVENTRQDRVLVVDDDPKVLMILEEALKLFGYQPVACSSAARALDIFRDAPDSFITVITDQAMPGMSGDQLIKEIRLINDSVPVILCTGYADLSVEEWESELDLFACLKKPFTMSVLSDVLARLSDR